MGECPVGGEEVTPESIRHVLTCPPCKDTWGKLAKILAKEQGL